MADIELVIKISEDSYKATCNGCMLPPDVENVVRGIKNGTPLDDVKAEIENRLEEEVTKTHDTDALKYHSWGLSDGLKDARDILDNIGKAEKGE